MGSSSLKLPVILICWCNTFLPGYTTGPVSSPTLYRFAAKIATDAAATPKHLQYLYHFFIAASPSHIQPHQQDGQQKGKLIVLRV
jgi:hypothetical protein